MATPAIAKTFPVNEPASPNFVWAPGPTTDRSPAKLYTFPKTIRGLLDDRLNAKVGEYCGLVHGNFGNPGLGSMGLPGAVALFSGLKRPMIQSHRDDDIHVYVTNPVKTYTYRRYDEAPKELAAPFGSVFATYVDFNATAVDEARAAMSDPKIDGVISFWEWVMADGTEPTLPDSFGQRYQRRVW